MTRREFTVSCLAAAAATSIATISPASAAPGTTPLSASGSSEKTKNDGKQRISFLIFEGMTPLDLIGPAQFLSSAGNVTVDYVWRNRNPVYGDYSVGNKMGFVPTATFDEIEKTDILCVPGTHNPYALLDQEDLIAWVAKVGSEASWVTSVCTGSFVLGAAGLLKGYKAASHWTMVDDLAYFGAIPTKERVVRDRNRITGGGVTSGIDFGLTLLSIIRDEESAKATQLGLEYDPHPPFNSGSPRTAAPEMVAAMQSRAAATVKLETPDCRQRLEKAAARLGVTVSG